MKARRIHIDTKRWMSVRRRWVKGKGSIKLRVVIYRNVYLRTNLTCCFLLNITKCGTSIPWCDKVCTFSKNPAGPTLIFQTSCISMILGKCLCLPQPEVPQVCNGVGKRCAQHSVTDQQWHVLLSPTGIIVLVMEKAWASGESQYSNQGFLPFSSKIRLGLMSSSWSVPGTRPFLDFLFPG